MGRRWYDDGKMFQKKNTFNDFIDVSEFLISEGWTKPDRLVCAGGSAGGLLIGAVSICARLVCGGSCCGAVRRCGFGNAGRVHPTYDWRIR